MGISRLFSFLLNCRLSRIRTRIVRVEGEHDDHQHGPKFEAILPNTSCSKLPRSWATQVSLGRQFKEVNILQKKALDQKYLKNVRSITLEICLIQQIQEIKD